MQARAPGGSGTPKLSSNSDEILIQNFEKLGRKCVSLINSVLYLYLYIYLFIVGWGLLIQ